MPTSEFFAFSTSENDKDANIILSFNLGQVEEGSSDCVGAIIGTDLGFGDNVWLVGDT